MADFTGIEAVTDTLRQLLLQRMEASVGLTVRTAPLDADGATAAPYVNLFLYRISENAEIRNQDLPGRGGPLAFGRPPLSLDLHYLMTAAGIDIDEDRGAQRLLGDAMLVLHDHAIIPQDDPVLHPALVGEVELLKISVDSLDSEDLTKIWTASTSAFRLSVGYKVTVVQLESTLPRRMPKPVLEPPTDPLDPRSGPYVFAVPIDRPQIVSLLVIRPPGTEEMPVPYARTGDVLVIRGSSFYPGTRVLLDGFDASANIAPESTGSTLFVEVPEDPALQAGIRRLELVRNVEVGSNDVPLMRSGVTAFVLIPRIDSITAASGAAGSNLTIDGTNLIAGDGPTFVVVGDQAIEPTAATASQLQIVIPALPADTYPVSVRVNGAESIDPEIFQVT
jgi:hypothetical protein